MLPPACVAPDLGNNNAGCSQLKTSGLRNAQPGDHGGIVSVDGDQRTGIENQCTHSGSAAVGASMPSSSVAAAI